MCVQEGAHTHVKHPQHTHMLLLSGWQKSRLQHGTPPKFNQKRSEWHKIHLNMAIKENLLLQIFFPLKAFDSGFHQDHFI